MKSFVLVAAFAFLGTAALAGSETTINVKEMNVTNENAPGEEIIVEPGAVEVKADSDTASEEKAK